MRLRSIDWPSAQRENYEEGHGRPGPEKVRVCWFCATCDPETGCGRRASRHAQVERLLNESASADGIARVARLESDKSFGPGFVSAEFAARTRHEK